MAAEAKAVEFKAPATTQGVIGSMLVTWAIANQKEECQYERFDAVQLHLKEAKTETYKQ